jgi:hypothetical protein
VSQRYKMQEELGAGAQATVFKATHRKTHGKVPTQPGPALLASCRLRRASCYAARAATPRALQRACCQPVQPAPLALSCYPLHLATFHASRRLFKASPGQPRAPLRAHWAMQWPWAPILSLTLGLALALGMDWLLMQLSFRPYLCPQLCVQAIEVDSASGADT